MHVKRIERGWAGHYICANDCLFRRNTLIEYGNKKWIISTVGNKMYKGKMDCIGYKRYYETMAFEACLENGYWDADVSKQIGFESGWELSAESEEAFFDKYPLADEVANNMHEDVVRELMDRIVRA